MANIVPNESLGLTRRYLQNVEDNSPAAALVRVHAWVITTADTNIIDMTGNTVQALAALADVAEATNTDYTNQSFDDADITIDVNDANNRIDISYSDLTFTSVDDGDDWTHITVSYDASGSDTDSNTEVLHVLDFVLSPNGGDVTVDFPAVCYRIAQA
jgi:hypothetical protein